jgi:hypothetical protein
MSALPDARSSLINAIVSRGDVAGALDGLTLFCPDRSAQIRR